ncbi:MAG TPA: MFS transporter [Myxococcota bacterium]|nr:MFS transporter [Myxococcota bacterium]
MAVAEGGAAQGADRKPGLGPILFTVFMDLLGFGLVIPLLGFYAEQFSASPLQVTLLMSSYSVAQFLGAPLWGMLSDRYGRRPILLASIAASAVFLSAFASATELWMLFLFRTLHGLCAANISTAQAYVADVTEGKDRARGMGLVGAAFGVGFSFGPLVGGQLSSFGLAAPIWLAAGLSVVNVVWVAARLPESRRSGASDAHRKTIDPRALVAGLLHPVVGAAIGLTFMATFAFAMLESTFQLVAEHAWSMTARDVGNLFGFIGLIGIVVQGGLIRRLVPRFGEVRLVAGGYLLMSAGMAALGLAGVGALPWLGCALVAFGSSMANPSLQSLISRTVSEDEQGAILGVNQSFSALARASAPAVGGVVYQAVFPQAPLLLGAALMALAVLASVPATRRALAAVS